MGVNYYTMLMNDATNFLAGLSVVALISVWVWFVKVKKSLKEELIDPAIDPIKDKITALEKKVASLESNDKDLARKLETQFNSLKESLATTNQKLAQMQGSLDIIINRLEK